jgi:hypothetical protein
MSPEGETRTGFIGLALADEIAVVFYFLPTTIERRDARA